VKDETKSYLGLFGTGLIQVTLVALNTFQIAHEKWLGVMGVGFLISLIWAWNVKKIAFGGWSDRIAYASGAAVGSGLGLLIGKLLYLL
jgi:hypothetical protein